MQYEWFDGKNGIWNNKHVTIKIDAHSNNANKLKLGAMFPAFGKSY